MAYREWDWIQQPLGQKIRLLSEKGLERQVYLSPAEVETLARGMPEPARTVMLLAAYTGLRRGVLLQRAKALATALPDFAAAFNEGAQEPHSGRS